MRYWQKFVSDKQSNVAELDRERERVVNAIGFGLDHEEPRGEALALLRGYASHLEWRGHWEDWGRLLNRAIHSVRRIDDVEAATIFTIDLAKLAQRQGKIEAAIDHYRQAIRLARQAGNRFQKARAYSNLGYLYTEQGDWPRAEAMCRHALQLFEALGSDHGRAHTENHLGLLFLSGPSGIRPSITLKQPAQFGSRPGINMACYLAILI